MKQERYLDKFNIFKQFKDRLWSQSICCCVLIRLVIITTLYHESANTLEMMSRLSRCSQMERCGVETVYDGLETDCQ